MSTADGTLHIVELLVGNDKQKSEIIERARTSPLSVREELRGEGDAEATYGLDLGWNGARATVRVMASARVTCDSSPEKHIKAFEHCKSLVEAVVADEIPRMQRLMRAMSDVDK